MEISVIGLNHRTAPVEVRERFALPADLAGELLQIVRAEKIFSEALVLDTCNRTEIYFVSKGDEDGFGHLLAHIGRLKGNSTITDRSVFYEYRGLEAVRQIFRVAASLDSQIVGEHQILGQLKDAYRMALDAGMSRFLLNKLLHRAFRVGKQVQTQTDLGQGSVSVASAAVELARQIFADLTGKTVLLVGAGQTAELAAQSLIRKGVSHLLVANRTLDRAKRLAGDLAAGINKPPVKPGAKYEREGQRDKGTKAQRKKSTEEVAGLQSGQALRTRAVSLNNISSVIGQVDLAICSVGSTEPVLTYEGLAKSLSRGDRPLLIIDISVPRCVEGRLGKVANVFLSNIDDLNGIVDHNLQLRRSEIPRAQAIVDYQVQQFGKWLDSLQVAPTIKLLQQYFQQLQEAQISRYGRKLSSSQRQELKEFSRSLCSKILHKPVSFLRELAGNSRDIEELAVVDTIRRMFDLDSMEQSK